MSQPKKHDIKFRVSEDFWFQYHKDINRVSERYHEPFNASRFMRLCASKINDDDFLRLIGYFKQREDIFKSLGFLDNPNEFGL